MRMKTFRKNPALFFLFLGISLLTIFAQAQQPPACTPPPSGMVAWWRADGSATDVVGGNDGTPRGRRYLHAYPLRYQCHKRWNGGASL